LQSTILQDLDDEQRAAVTDEGGRLLIVAGAGSGKTRVITRRIAWRVYRGVPAHRILAITFTNKAAREMAARVDQLLPGSAAWVSTFHSFAARMLRLDGTKIGISREFTILDHDDQVQVVKRQMQARGVGTREVRPEGILHQISRWKNRVLCPADADDGASSSYDRLAAEIYASYQAALTAAHCLDFDDLLLRCLELLRHPAYGSAWKARFVEVLVDEYQDTNRVQGEILAEITSRSAVTACGDPDQSIYSWRGADLSNILEFEQRFPGTRIVRLQSNYRSTGAIVEVASRLIRNNVQRIDRELFSVGPRGTAPVFHVASSESEEAEFVARTIKSLEAQGIPPSEVAVLYRTNAFSRPFERVFRGHAIPYQVIGAVEFFERKEVRDLHSFLRLKVNPFDVEAWRRIVNLPPRGIGERTQQALLVAAAGAALSPVDLVLERREWPRLRGAANRGMEQLRELLSWWMEERDTSVHELLQLLVDRIDYYGYLERQIAPAAIDRGDNVRALLADAFEFDQRGDPGGLRGYLEERSLVQDTDRLGASDLDGVSLMTLHSAKGLEFRAVFLVAFEAEVLPHRRSLEEGGIEEERRLLYVGITRARELLFLTRSCQRFAFGRMEVALPSPFLEEVLDPSVSEPPIERIRVVEEEFEAWSPEGFEEEVAAQDFRVGDNVEHESFGVGEVIDVQGRGIRRRVRVRFAAGEKNLHLAYGRLRKV